MEKVKIFQDIISVIEITATIQRSIETFKSLCECDLKLCFLYIT